MKLSNKVKKRTKKLLSFDLKKIRRNMETMYAPHPRRSTKRRRGY